MNNLVFGISTVLICTIGYFYSWKFHLRDNYKWAVLLLVLCGLALRMYVSMDFFLHVWDEQYHALVAKHFIQHPLIPTLYNNPVLPYNFKNWPANYIWLHKQPLPLWAIALSLKLFGINAFAVRLPSILLTTTGIWLTYAIGRALFNKKVGYLAAFFYSLNGLIVEITGGRVATDHIDTFFLFFIELAIYFSIRFIQNKRTWFNILAGMAMGAAVLSKWLPALIVLPVWLILIWDSGKFTIKTTVFQFAVLLMTGMVVFLPWQIYIFKTFPLEAAWESAFNVKHFTQVIEHHAGTIFYYFNKIRINDGELIYLPLLWFIWKACSDFGNKKRLAVLVWFLVPFLFFSFAKTKMQAYILFTAPALFLITAEFFFWLSDYKKNHSPKWLFSLILFLLIALPARYTIERIKPFEKRDRHPQWVVALKKLNRQKIKNGLLFNYKKPIEAMFYTNLTVYPGIPDKKTVENLIKQGYTVMINSGNIPQPIAGIQGVKIENLPSPLGK